MTACFGSYDDLHKLDFFFVLRFAICRDKYRTPTYQRLTSFMTSFAYFKFLGTWLSPRPSSFSNISGSQVHAYF